MCSPHRLIQSTDVPREEVKHVQRRNVFIHHLPEDRHHRLGRPAPAAGQALAGAPVPVLLWADRVLERVPDDLLKVRDLRPGHAN